MIHMGPSCISIWKHMEANTHTIQWQIASSLRGHKGALRGSSLALVRRMPCVYFQRNDSQLHTISCNRSTQPLAGVFTACDCTKVGKVHVNLDAFGACEGALPHLLAMPSNVIIQVPCQLFVETTHPKSFLVKRIKDMKDMVEIFHGNVDSDTLHPFPTAQGG